MGFRYLIKTENFIHVSSLKEIHYYMLCMLCIINCVCTPFDVHACIRHDLRTVFLHFRMHFQYMKPSLNLLASFVSKQNLKFYYNDCNIIRADCNLHFLHVGKLSRIEATSFEVFKAFIVYLYTDEIHIDIDYVAGA